jgi:peptidoglycan hydrolase CwlO-like protein
MSDAVIVALVTSGLAAIGGVVSAAISAHTRSITSTTRRENADQHAESQDRLAELTKAVHHTGGKVDGLRDDIKDLGERHDELHGKFHRHLGSHHPDLEEDR